jgi:hypothetical protein
MKLLILGATGPTGRHVVDLAPSRAAATCRSRPRRPAADDGGPRNQSGEVGSRILSRRSAAAHIWSSIGNESVKHGTNGAGNRGTVSRL